MKLKLLGLSLLLSLSSIVVQAQSFVNLTPRPKTMVVGSGTLVLPSSFSINCNGLDEAITGEVEQFAQAISNTTGSNVSVTDNDDTALFQISLSAPASLKTGGYTLSINANKVTIRAKEVLGVFYALQSVKKILPPNVMAGVKDETVSTYALPVVTITDEPRFEYRGFMLDVSRHFFTVEEVKRMLDVMSYYKMNTFHWHLSDDQGWRVEIKKYPRLTTVASIAPNCRFTDMYEKKAYWINKPYGPYFYTQDQIKEVVAYAQKLHIDIIPEIDMPGHFCAALTAYPEFSCSPKGTHVVQSDGGIFNDVMNVANPDAVQFTKDILSELMEMFPGEYIHIGGDECPVTVWQSNDECKAKYEELGLTDFRQLQSHFIKEMADHVKANGKKLAVWNEGITADNADLDIMKETGATVYCWTGAEAAANKAETLGLPRIFTPWGPYYINRRQGDPNTDPPGAGPGNEDVKKTYEASIPTNIDFGVQGTFWTEWVSDREYMEWLALPRLIAVAERGWTSEDRASWTDFQQRMTADTVLLNYNDYKYCKYKMLGEDSGTSDMVLPKVNTTDNKYYYRIISGGTDATRKGRCIELLSASSPLLTTYSGKNAAVNRLWTNTQASEGDSNYDYQWWSIEADPSGSGKYALVCKALPDGSVNPTPTATNTSGRWNYDTNKKNYNFELGTNGYGTVGNNYYYTLSSDKVSGQWLNSSMSGQGLAVNMYSKPGDGNGGYWQFAPMDGDGDVTPVQPDAFPYLEVGKYYTFDNNVEGFEGKTLVDDNNGTNLKAVNSTGDASNAWKVTSSTINEDGSQTLKLQNAVTERYIASVGAYETRNGYPVSVGAAGANLTLSLVKKYSDYRLQIASKSLFPLTSGKIYAGSTISGASYDAARGQGAEWTFAEVKIVNLNCIDESGKVLTNGKYTIPADVAELTLAQCPTIKNHSAVSVETTGEDSYTITYKRSTYSLTYSATDEHGVLIDESEVEIPIGESATIAIPSQKYYTLQSSSIADGTTITPTEDIVVNAVYTTDAYTGVKKVADAVTSLEGLVNGNQYLLYDATTASGRSGYRIVRESDNQVNRSTTAEGLTPNGVWTLEGSGNSFKVKNEYTDLYVPALVRSTATTASTAGVAFTFALNNDGETWNIKGSNGQYWDGLENGALVGWNSGTGHPIAIYRFYVQPMYSIKIKCTDTEGNTLKESTSLYNAGESYSLILPTITGYVLKETTGNETFDGIVASHLNINAVYKNSNTGIERITTDKANSKKGIYDIQGRRLNNIAHPGIYIVNGQKVIVK